MTPSSVDLACQHCGRAFQVEPSKSHRQFCSRTCKGLASRLAERECVTCGSLFRPPGARQLNCSVACGQRFSRAAAARPWRVGSRRLLARTCGDCGELLPADRYAASGDGTLDHRCILCVRARLTPIQRERKNRNGADADHRAQDATRPAGRWGCQWTGPELEIALRDDLTAKQAALMLGRTYFATQAARRKARTDPKWSSVVGV